MKRLRVLTTLLLGFLLLSSVVADEGDGDGDGDGDGAARFGLSALCFSSFLPFMFARCPAVSNSPMAFILQP